LKNIKFIRLNIYVSCLQARNQGAQRGESPPRKSFVPLGKCVGHSLKLSDIVQNMWAPLGKLFAPPGVPSWLGAWLLVIVLVTNQACFHFLVCAPMFAVHVREISLLQLHSGSLNFV